MSKQNSIKSSESALDLEGAKRRHFIQVMGGIAGTAAATAMLSGCNYKVATDYVNKRPHPPKNEKVFSEYEMTVLHDICEAILPKTDTPSAAELDCHGFVQHQLQQCHSHQQQNNCVQIINKIDWQSDNTFGKAYPLLSAEQKRQLLQNVENWKTFNQQDSDKFRFLKALIVFGYFTTEAGATKALNYQAVPGGFIGSTPVDAETKAWGSLAYY